MHVPRMSKAGRHRLGGSGGQPPNRHMQLGRCCGGVRRVFLRYFDVCDSVGSGLPTSNTGLMVSPLLASALASHDANSDLGKSAILFQVDNSIEAFRRLSNRERFRDPPTIAAPSSTATLRHSMLGIRRPEADGRDNMLRSPLSFGIPNAVLRTKSSGKS